MQGFSPVFRGLRRAVQEVGSPATGKDQGGTRVPSGAYWYSRVIESRAFPGIHWVMAAIRADACSLSW